ncbi:MAG: ACP S-malonyltransferase [Candidatus Cloacimonetes bacterium]|nr:ACP S-malonyltransferase [Candidatus Cloacimonadota bacterium]
MGKTAFIFPGQGAQYVGMAADFIRENPDLEKILKEFEKQNRIDLHKIMMEGPESVLRETHITQPAILFHSIAAWKYFSKRFNLVPDYVAGHSLGEFSALVVNGVLDFSDAMYLVHKRGDFMLKANQSTPFAMSAIIGLDAGVIKQLCEQVAQTDLVIAANFNTPEQTVISGTHTGVEKVTELVKAKGVKRVIPLSVGGPFHSPLIARAEEWLSQEMAEISFTRSEIPLISNFNAESVNDPETIKQNLARQITSPVLWVDSVLKMISLGVDRFFEFGPRKVLSGMIKKIDRNVKILSLDTIEDFYTIESELE